MFKRPTLSNLIYTDRQIIIHGFQYNHVHPGKFLPLDFEKIDYKNFLKLKYLDNLVGTFQTAIHHRDDNSIYLYFETKIQNFKPEGLWAKLNTKPKTIQCPICNSYFKENEMPCKCLKGAPFINYLDFTLESVQLVSYKTDNQDSYDCRDETYSKFFGGATHSLTFLEEL